MPQYELSRDVADVHRVAATAGAELVHHWLGVQPAGGQEARLVDLANDLLIVEDRAGSRFFDGLGHSRKPENSLYRDFRSK